MVSVDRDTFLDNLHRSGLLSERAFAAARQRLPETSRGRVVARLLVEWELITKFQAELLLIGRTNGFFIGPYKILDQLGQGGMGRVYKALHQPMRRVVALKVLTPQVMKTARAEKLFGREVRAAAQLHHPNIATAFDAGEHQGRHYLAMEFVDGPNLQQLVHARGPLPVSLACELMRQTAAGLQHAHEMGMLHRDLKPANLLLQRRGTSSVPVVKILDFGLARLQPPSAVAPGSATIIARQNVIMGTPDFLSPEQARDLHRTDIRSDLYSLGCTMYYLLAGTVPFPGDNVLEKLLRHSTEPPAPLSSLRGDVPEAVSHIVSRLMAKKPDDRYQTPQELVDALTPLAHSADSDWQAARSASPSAADSEEAAENRVDTLPQVTSLTPWATDTSITVRRRWPRTAWRWTAAAASIASAAGLGMYWLLF